MQLNRALIQQLIAVISNASEAILSVYHDTSFTVENKADSSPVTEADIAAHKILVEGLPRILPLPVLSEESAEVGYQERKQWQRYWLVDPLDGTKEFVERNDEFTVNIALIENHYPVLGIIMVPVNGSIFWGIPGQGAYRYIKGIEHPLHSKQLSEPFSAKPITLVSSRRHGHSSLVPLMARLESTFGCVNTLNAGSSLKFCMVAEGKADIYPRLAPTSEWDTAAAQAIVEASGGAVVDTNFQRLPYNTKESLLNPDFYVLGGQLQNWKVLLE